jgi:hypothetical protein
LPFQARAPVVEETAGPACVIYWQAKEISRVARIDIPGGEDIDFRLLEHVSPIEWENVILYGQYVLNQDNIR